MTAPMTAVGMGNQRYFDVYLDDPSSSEEDEYIDLSRPLMSPRKFPHRIPSRPTPVKTNTPDTKLPKRKPVWYFKRKKDCLQAFYIVMIIMVIVIFALVLMRILNDASKHRTSDDKKQSHLTAIAALGNFAMSRPFGINVNLKPTAKPTLSSIVIEPSEAIPKTPTVASHGEKSKVDVDVEEPKQEPQRKVLPCTKYTVQDVWVQNIPQLQLESGIRLLDVNQDGVLDAIIGFSTDATAYFADQYLMCSIYFNGTVPCFGGVLALDGITGQELWRHYSSMEVFAVNCNGDLTGDRVNDCAIAGRAGVMEAVDGTSGKLLWKYHVQEAGEALSNFYTAQFIHDVNGDGVRDLLNALGGDPVREPGAPVIHSGNVMLLSGLDGSVISMCGVPDGMESYYSPQIFYQHGGKAMVLFGTGGETVGGSLWAIPLDDIIICNMTQVKVIYTDPFKGVMTPPVLVDLTGDRVKDIVMSMFNSTVIAFNGQTYQQLWNYTMPSSESYSTPAAGFYNDDDVPDFMVVYNYGPGYPLYYYVQINILDGRNGQPLLQKNIISSGSATTSPLTVSTEGYGNDAFFYWRLACEGHEQETEAFSFTGEEGASKGSLSRTNFCRERFNSGSVTTGSLLNQHMDVPGQVVYTSADRFEDEHRYTVNATRMAMDYLKKYPEVIPIILDAQKQGDKEEENKSHEDNYQKGGSAKEENKQSATDSALSNIHNQDSEPTTIPPQSRTHSLDFQNEYDKLLARLSALSDNLKDQDDSPNKATNLEVNIDKIDKIPTESFQAKKETEADDATLTTTSPSYDDALLSGDIAGGLKDLGLPESWFDSPKEKKSGQVSGDETPQDDLQNLSEEELEGILKDLLELDEEAKNDGKTKRFVSKRNAKMFASRSDTPRDKQHQRSRRHAGLHDAGGIQRLISTGTLAPPLSPVLDDLPSDPNSIDVIFATYWFYPKPNRIITAREQKCLDDWTNNEQQRMDPSNEYYGLDHDAYEHLGSDNCGKLAASATASPTESPTDPLNIYPFNLDAGEMTVYRLRLSCDCGLKEAQRTNPGARCAKILPYHQQEWGAYMGTYGNSYFRERIKEDPKA
ncbi:uncharacterized protein LOC121419916 isoform X1 [Lytechinus variegatus]|uniref:uncharacterized protein LOC121419916 isoform X1 n=1 Tax=Lytechinus variegatus TaxID=7654 RepID=UPI001BB16078|nr:uncharacterized protein LOC121419916 isoform X1 [Lytechinus variegatus]